MRALKIITGLALLAALALLYVSFRIAPEQGPGFWIGLLINLAAGFLVLATGLIATVAVASSVAKERLGKLAPKLMKFIRQLREDEAISGHAARYAVICSVDLISEKHLEADRSTGDPSREGTTVHCNVCALTSETDPNSKKGVRCWHCKLPGEVWQLDEEHRKSLPESAPSGT